MTEKEKREAFVVEMESLGVKKIELEPPLYRLLWACGVSCPPPLLATGMQRFRVNAIFGALLGSLLSYWLYSIYWKNSPEDAVMLALLFILVLPALLHFHIEGKRKKYTISGYWPDYTPPDENAEQNG
jgi:hypothetical protein